MESNLHQVGTYLFICCLLICYCFIFTQVRRFRRFQRFSISSNFLPYILKYVLTQWGSLQYRYVGRYVGLPGFKVNARKLELMITDHECQNVSAFLDTLSQYLPIYYYET